MTASGSLPTLDFRRNLRILPNPQVFCVDTNPYDPAIVRALSQRTRTELDALLKKVEKHRQRILELQQELALLMQKVARVGSRGAKTDGTRKGGPPRRYK